MIDNNTQKTIRKFKEYRSKYRRFLYHDVADLKCQISEIMTPEDMPEMREKFASAIPTDGWRDISSGDTWGSDFGYGWFRTEYEVAKQDEGKELLILPVTGASESLLFINGKPAGLFDVCMRYFSNQEKNERFVQFTKAMWGTEDIAEAADIFEEYVRNVGVESRLSQFGCTNDSLEELTNGVVDVSFSSDGTLASIPPITKHQAYEIYKLAL